VKKEEGSRNHERESGVEAENEGGRESFLPKIWSENEDEEIHE